MCSVRSCWFRTTDGSSPCPRCSMWWWSSPSLASLVVLAAAVRFGRGAALRRSESGRQGHEQPVLMCGRSIEPRVDTRLQGQHGVVTHPGRHRLGHRAREARAPAQRPVRAAPGALGARAEAECDGGRGRPPCEDRQLRGTAASGLGLAVGLVTPTRAWGPHRTGCAFSRPGWLKGTRPPPARTIASTS
jgi:hypothetical protein